MKKQTAVNWLIEQLNLIEWIEDDGIPHIHLKIVEEAKEMEKQQIIDAAERWKGTDFAEKYYAETYGSKGSDDHIVETNEMVSTDRELALFVRWLLKHYSTSIIDGMFAYVNSLNKEVDIETIIKHYKSEQ